MKKIETTGDSPGWIYGHTAIVTAANELCISDGQIVTISGDDEVHEENQRIFVFNTEQQKWSAQ